MPFTSLSRELSNNKSPAPHSIRKPVPAPQPDEKPGPRSHQLGPDMPSPRLAVACGRLRRSHALPRSGRDVPPRCPRFDDIARVRVQSDRLVRDSMPQPPRRVLDGAAQQDDAHDQCGRCEPAQQRTGREAERPIRLRRHHAQPLAVPDYRGPEHRDGDQDERRADNRVETDLASQFVGEFCHVPPMREELALG
jgi:hypothetical protein